MSFCATRLVALFLLSLPLASPGMETSHMDVQGTVRRKFYAAFRARCARLTLVDLLMAAEIAGIVKPGVTFCAFVRLFSSVYTTDVNAQFVVVPKSLRTSAVRASDWSLPDMLQHVAREI